MHKSAIISDCGQYRYKLSRCWDENESQLVFVMLNPSTADAEEDDPTIRRCMGFAEGFGYGGIHVINLYALRSPSPSVLKQHPDPVGPDSGQHWHHTVRDYDTDCVICAWGAQKGVEQRVNHFVSLAEWAGVDLKCLGVTKGGAPKHPLYLAKTTAMEPFYHEEF